MPVRTFVLEPFLGHNVEAQGSGPQFLREVSVFEVPTGTHGVYLFGRHSYNFFLK